MTSAARQSTLIIQTPEGIEFELVLASPVTRFFALMIDRFLMIAASTVIMLATLALRIISPDFGAAMTAILCFALSFAYPIGFEWLLRGQTIGKKIFRLKVMDVQGLKLRFSQIVVRNLLRYVDAVPLGFYLVGGTACFFSSRCQRLGDLAGNTIVVVQPKIAEPGLNQIGSVKYNSFRRYPEIAGRLRRNVAPHEAELFMRALLRRESFDPEARIGLFSRLREHLEKKVPFPDEAAEGLSDEQYVRNAVDVLLR
ncbi:MAG: RDD family protein [Kiritimatiellia bacterium]